jgi:hypothetical protein
MGECDRFKNYISDYLDNTLDPTTHKEFEKALRNSGDLKRMTHKVSILRSRLHNLSYQTCSDDFSLKLRERIHTESEPVISKQNMVRLSFVFSFIVIVAFAIFSLNNFLDSTETTLPVQKSSGFQNQSTSPSSNPASGNNNNAFVKDDEVEVKTKDSQETLQDSSGVKPGRTPESKLKQIDQQK